MDNKVELFRNMMTMEKEKQTEKKNQQKNNLETKVAGILRVSNFLSSEHRDILF